MYSVNSLPKLNGPYIKQSKRKFHNVIRNYCIQKLKTS
jgi:hypothetical protein